LIYAFVDKDPAVTFLFFVIFVISQFFTLHFFIFTTKLCFFILSLLH